MTSITAASSGASEGKAPAAQMVHRVLFLDTLRFIAAAAVFLQHSLEGRCERCVTFVAELSPGVFGVVLFFIISGFVIPMTAGRTFHIGTFAIKRFFRIYPLVLFAFAVTAILASQTDLAAFDLARSAGVKVWVVNLLLVQDYFGVRPVLGVTWTLSLEFAWYAVFALSTTLIGRRFDDWLIVVAPLGLLALVGASLVIHHRLPLGRIGMIYIAGLGCRAYRQYRGDISTSRLAIDATVFIVVTMFSNAVSFGYFKHPTITMMQAILPWTLAPILFLSVCLSSRIRHSWILTNRLLTRLGAISFSIYLLHPLALVLSDGYFPTWWSFTIGLAGTLALSLVAYEFIEKPGQMLGRRFTSAVATTAVPATSANSAR